MYAIIPDSSTTVLLIKYFQYEPPNATWWQGCSRLSRSNLLFDDKLSLGALGSPGAIHYLTAKLSHSQGEALKPHGEALATGQQGERRGIQNRRSPTSLRKQCFSEAPIFSALKDEALAVFSSLQITLSSILCSVRVKQVLDGKSNTWNVPSRPFPFSRPEEFLNLMGFRRCERFRHASRLISSNRRKLVCALEHANLLNGRPAWHSPEPSS